jgi:hypothetical protein
MLDRFDHVEERNLLRRARQAEAAAKSLLRMDKFRPGQRLQEFAQVVLGRSNLLGDLGSSGVSSFGQSGQRRHRSDCVQASLGNHELTSFL